MAWMAWAAALALGDAQAADARRSYSGTRYTLEINGADAGGLRTAEGGWISAGVVSMRSGTEPGVMKSLANPKYEEISCQSILNPSKLLGEWITATLEGGVLPREGKVLDLDGNLAVRSALSFRRAFLAEISFPALEAASKETGYLTLKIKPEYADFELGDGTLRAGAGSAKQKLWRNGNFRLKIDGLDCTRVSKIDALVFKQKLSEYRDGGSREVRILPAGLETPDLAVTLSLASAADWVKWAKSFMVEGKQGSAGKKQGTIELLTPDLKNVMAELQFSGLGIRKLQPFLGEEGEAARQIRAEMYFEGLRVKFLN